MIWSGDGGSRQAGKCRWIDGWEQRRDANRSFPPPHKSLIAQICKLLHLGSGNFYILDEKISNISNLETVTSWRIWRKSQTS
jgi:hypothetical protein